jgi:hypothetical protein
MESGALEFTADDFWHRQVHQRLGEKLHFYIVRARPLDTPEIINSLKTLIATGFFGSIHVFPIFGSYDVLIRIWLHPTNEDRFRHDLSSAMAQAGEERRINGFTVDAIEQSWYAEDEVKEESLRALNEDIILRIQDNKAPADYKSFRTQKLILRRKYHSNGILFFVAVQLRPEFDEEHARHVAIAIRDSAPNHSDIHNVSIYRSTGHASILLRGEAQDYFAIERLGWIRRRFKTYGATTETYLVQTRAYLFADEKIGRGTFSALHGRDLLVQSILPELYEAPFEKAHDIKRAFDDDIHGVSLVDGDRNLLHDFLMGRLESNPVRMMTALFTFFVEVEQYLRERHQEFVGRQNVGSLKDIYTKVNISDNKRYLTLGDVLKVYEHVIKVTSPEHSDLVGDWEDFAKLRNEIAHGGVDIMGEWETLLKRLLAHLPRLRRLLPYVANVTAKECVGTYFGSQV